LWNVSCRRVVEKPGPARCRRPGFVTRGRASLRAIATCGPPRRQSHHPRVKTRQEECCRADQLGVARRGGLAEDRRGQARQCEIVATLVASRIAGARGAERKFTLMRRSNERGSAQLRFLIVLIVILTSAYAGYLYIPVAFKARTYKDVMQHYADVAGASG